MIKERGCIEYLFLDIIDNILILVESLIDSNTLGKV